MRGSILYLIIVLLATTNSFSQNSNKIGITPDPNPLTVINGDASLTIYGKGSKQAHWVESSDGYLLLKDSIGRYQYAIEQSGELNLSGSVAYDNFKDNSNSISEDPYFKIDSEANIELITDILSKSSVDQLMKAVSEGSHVPTSGVIKVACLLIEYPDLQHKYEKETINTLLNGEEKDGKHSFKSFYFTSSWGKLTIEVDLYGWYQASKSYKEYSEDSNPSYGTYELVSDIIDSADADIDFSKYDNDGDGDVDGLLVLHSGAGAEQASQTEYIWSHRWTFKEDIVCDGIDLSNYIVVPEIYTRGTPTDLTNIGIICHEFGHNFGLPDLYDTDGSSEGIGNWGVMSSGNWLNRGANPADFCGWSKYQLGWVTPKYVAESKALSIPVSISKNEVIIVPVEENSTGDEYFILENRQQEGLDSYLPGSGLAIWHCNDSQPNNKDEDNPIIGLEQADGLNDLENDENRGDSGDLFPGATSNRSFTASTAPNSNKQSNEPSNVSISDITQLGDDDDNAISLNLSIQEGPDPFSEDNFSIKTYTPTCADNYDGRVIITSTVAHMSLYIEELYDSYAIELGTPLEINNLAPGEYTFELTTSYNETRYFTVVIKDIDKLSVNSEVSSNNIYLSISGGTAPYNIYVNNTEYTSLDGDITISMTEPGIHKVNIMDSNYCSKTDDIVVSNERFSFYPNPISDGIINIIMPSTAKSGRYRIVILDSSGTVVYNQYEELISNRFTLEIGDQQSGIYLMNIFDSNGLVYKQNNTIIIK